MADDFGQRAFWAHRAAEQRFRRDISQKEIGERVAKRLGEPRPIHQSTAGKWLKSGKEGGAVPDVPTIAALALEFAVDPGWLAFGGASRAPAPDGYSPPAAKPPAVPPAYHGKPVEKSASTKRRRSG
jgi:transcriptional regulator with XRE-family HTH domain